MLSALFYYCISKKRSKSTPSTSEKSKPDNATTIDKPASLSKETEERSATTTNNNSNNVNINVSGGPLSPDIQMMQMQQQELQAGQMRHEELNKLQLREHDELQEKLRKRKEEHEAQESALEGKVSQF